MPDIDSFVVTNFHRVSTGRLALDRVYSGRPYGNVLALFDETAEKPFRNRASTNVSRANKENVFQKERTVRDTKVAGIEVKMTGSKWKDFRYRLEEFGLRTSAALVRLLPRAAVVRLAQIAGALAYTFDRKGREVALNNLALAFGDRYSPAERMALARESFQHFAMTMFDLMWSPQLTKENFSRYVEVVGFPKLDPGVHFIVACFHYSNFEWLSFACGFLGGIATIIAQEFRNPLLEPIFRGWRERAGHRFINREGAILILARILRRGGNTALLADLTVPAGPAAVAIDCFGLMKSMTPALAWLHQQSGAPILPAYCEPLPGGRYRIVFQPAITLGKTKTIREITQACWDSFEPIVRANPAPWLWMYKHWRYHPSENSGHYPAYASAHRRFDRMLAQP